MTRTWTTPDSSASNASASIASSRGGPKKDCPMKKSCGAASSASMRSIRLCSADEFPATRSAANSTNRADLCRGLSLLAKAWLHFLWRTDRTDRYYANRAGRKEKMDQPVALFACIELLHAPSWSRSSTAGHLRRLAFAQDKGRNCRRLFVRYSIYLCPVGVELYLRCIRQSPLDCRDLLWLEARGHRDRCGRSHSDWPQSAKERSDVDSGCARVCLDLLS